MAAKKDSRSFMRRELGRKLGDAALTKLDSLAKAGSSATEVDKAIMREIEERILKSITPSVTRAVKATVNRSIKSNVRKAILSGLPAIKSRAIKAQGVAPAIKVGPAKRRANRKH